MITIFSLFFPDFFHKINDFNRFTFNAENDKTNPEQSHPL